MNRLLGKYIATRTSVKTISSQILKYKSELMGIAAIFIVIVHSSIDHTFPHIKTLCQCGVDIFLLLGGFTCTLSYLKDSAIKRYYVKRLHRVYYPYILLLILDGLIAFILTDASATISIVKNFIYYALLIPPMYDNTLQIWYVPMILIMYAILPLYVGLCQRHNWAMLLPICIWLIIITLRIHDLSIPFFMVISRGPLFMIGINLCLLYKWDVEINVKKYVIDIIGVICLIAMWIWVDTRYFDRVYLELLYMAIIFLLVVNYNYRSKFLFFVGSLSLEIYLLHPIVKSLLTERLSQLDFWILTSVIVSTTIIASLSFNYIHSALYRIFSKHIGKHRHQISNI